MQAAPRLLNPRASRDALIAYAADAQDVYQAAGPVLAQYHRDGEDFAAAVVSAGATLLDHAAKVDVERLEAKDATATQDELLDEARRVIRSARRYASFVASELSHGGSHEGNAQARRVLTACGVGNSAALRRQSGVRRALQQLHAGLGQIEDVLAAWPPPEDFGRTVADLLTQVDEAIRAQSQEAMEADLAQEALDGAVEQAVTQWNRAVRLLGAYLELVPADVLTKIATLERNHSRVFYNGQPSIEPGGEPTGQPDGETDGQPEA